MTASHILLKKIEHRGSEHLGLFFDYNVNYIKSVKSLAKRSYSRTKRCWYLPLEKQSIEAFKALNIPYQLADNIINWQTEDAPTKDFDKVPIAENSAFLLQNERQGSSKLKSDIRACLNFYFLRTNILRT